MRSSSKFISYLVLFTFVYSTSVSLALVAKRAPQSVGDALLRRNTTDMGITRITVGRSKTKIKMLLDTGSALTYIKRSAIPSDANIGESLGPFSAKYADNTEVHGERYTARITIADKLKLPRGAFEFGVVDSNDTDIWDGIIGLAESEGDPPSLLQRMADTGIIQKRFGLNYRPMGANGGKRFVWGGVDDAFRGNLTYTSLIGDSEARNFINLGLEYVTITMNGMLIAQGKAFIDSGAGHLLLKADAYNAYLEATRATWSEGDQISTSFNNFQEMGNLQVSIHGIDPIDLNPFAQKVPYQLGGGHTHTAATNPDDETALNLRVGRIVDWHYYDIVLGMPFLERVYLDIDLRDPGNQRCGVARTEFTDAQID